MTEPPPVPPSGELSALPPEALMLWCEAQKFTGTLCFSASAKSVTFPLMAGLVELEGPDDPLAAALEAMLAATSGRYVLTQALPPIASSEVLGTLHLSGALGPDRVGDLMQYCEATGLSGELTLRHEGVVGESARGLLPQACLARYHRGELSSMTLNGREDLDLGSVFAWTLGRWEILALSAFSSRSVDSVPEYPVGEENLLRTFEVALKDILEQSAQSRTPSRRRPSLRPIASEPQDSKVPKLPPGAADTTIKVYFVKAAPPPVAVAPPQSPAPGADDGEKNKEIQVLGSHHPSDKALSGRGSFTPAELGLSAFSLLGLALALWLLADLFRRA